ncbi:MAG: response regulator [Lachnospiraceae bacterium]|nr:response regulator [Lachnospiraceae bacterium]
MDVNTIVWNKRYELGVEFLDKEHKKLFSTVNKLLALSQQEGKEEWACREGVKYLKNHTREHFQHEEAYMQSIEYGDYEVHKHLHDDFQNITLPSLEAELEETEYAKESIRHFLGVSIGWMVAHTQTEDLAIAGRKMSKWSALPKAEELDALEQTIIQLISDLFRMKGKTVSRQYGGEEFGKVFCCRFVYRGAKKERWEILLSFEERLILKIVSELMNTQYLKVDDMAINIIRYLSRQFIEKIKECFSNFGQYKLESEALMTHEQLVKAFEREHPSCSLLFDTGSGYFTFCVMTTDSLKGKIVTSLNAENAMNQIKDYLAGENRKKKILVVDDSDFMRKNMINLLGNDYEVTESSSSISAIKTLTRNRPDLVLLDYEMPVCDGKQTLEMIRMDEEIADIPVVFLTGRGDAESVRKVMALKPRGYLLKSMPQEDIKKFIDGIFAKEELAE